MQPPTLGELALHTADESQALRPCPRRRRASGRPSGTAATFEIGQPLLGASIGRHGVEGDPTVHKALPGMEQAQRAWRLAAYGRGQRLADAMRRKRILHPGREKEDARDVVDVEKIAGMQQPHYMRGMSDG